MKRACGLATVVLCAAALLVISVSLAWRSYDVGFWWADLFFLSVTLAPAASLVALALVYASWFVGRKMANHFMRVWTVAALIVAFFWVLLIAFSASVATRLAVQLGLHDVANNSILMIEASLDSFLFLVFLAASMACGFVLEGLRRRN